MSVRVCVLGSGSRGNAALIATERTRLLIDAGLSRRETYARLAAVGERADGFDAVVISHEHHDHIGGLRTLAPELRVPIYISPATHDAIWWRSQIDSFEFLTPDQQFSIGDIEITPFPVPHDAIEPVAFTLLAQGVKMGLVTDLGHIPEIVKQHAKGCDCLILESNHDLEMLRLGPYPWFVKQRVMSRQGHLSNRATAEFLRNEYDGKAEVLILAHLSQVNNHPELARVAALEAIEQRHRGRVPQLHLASQFSPTPVFRF